ncbi:PREDICTED: centrosomin isoform X2 [Nicrophorus vespilloides]|uniref:Centrosomin isoform X2 n=1 Tax=Nicrophorus vespilloides TaxID=110193 RepID=A0ABM1M5J2_NICVS|nr:PREDICTED: centrosomin isoform X2 [Nicrophorus vespilloides]
MSFFNFSGAGSPPRRSISQPAPKSPFCTSPSQLYETTLDADTSNAYSMGLGGARGASRGCSVKEFEEQLTTLRKENFNLKLRIYLLEERMGPNYNLDTESAVKKNIELSVELETLRKELQEKQDLLCQAVTAIEIEEEEYRKEAENKRKEIEDLKVQLDTLQQQFDMVQEESRSQGDHSSVDGRSEVFSQAFTLTNKVADLENQLRCERETVEKLSNLLKYPKPTLDVEELQVALTEKTEKLEQAMAELEEKSQSLAEVSSKLETVEQELLVKKDEVNYYEGELSMKANDLEEAQERLSEMEVLYEDTKAQREHEAKRNEKNKIAVSNRNNKISELEGTVERYKQKVLSLEAKLESAQNEVKSKKDFGSPRPPTARTTPDHSDPASFPVRSAATTPEHSPKSVSRVNSSGIFRPHRTTPNSSMQMSGNEDGDVSMDNTDHSFCVDDLQNELLLSRGHAKKLEQDQLKACRIIQTMIEKRKKSQKEIEELQRNVKERDEKIEELSGKLQQQHHDRHQSQMDDSNRSAMTNSSDPSTGNSNNSNNRSRSTSLLQTKISELNLTAASPTSDAECSALALETTSSENPQELLAKSIQYNENLETEKKLLKEILRVKDEHMEELQQRHERALEETKRLKDEIVDLQFEACSRDEQPSEKFDVGNEKVGYWIQKSEDKDKEIERLEKELKKRTCDLQSVVNKELWDKNREIERLQKSGSKDATISELRKDVAAKDDVLKALQCKLEERKALEDTFKEKLRKLSDERLRLLNEIEELKDEVSHLNVDEDEAKNLRLELETCERMRCDTQQVCQLLNVRLKELATFLSSLLKKKIVLGLLGHTSRIRQYIDDSLNLSRSLSLSINMNPDESLMQLSNISTLLKTQNDTLDIYEFLNQTNSEGGEVDDDDLDWEEEKSSLSLIPEQITFSYQSHIYNKPGAENKIHQQDRIIQKLRSQVAQLMSALQLRDNKLLQQTKDDEDLVNAIVSMNPPVMMQSVSSPDSILQNLMRINLSTNTSSTVKYVDHSGSDSWSEPDKSVSKARIGLDEECLKPVSKDDSTEGALSSLNKSRTPSKRSSSASENKQIIRALTNQIECLERRLEEKDVLCNEEIVKTEGLILEIVQLNEKLEESRSSLSDSESKVQQLQQIIEELHSNKCNLIKNMNSKTKSVQNMINQLECERAQAMAEAKDAEEHAKIARGQVAEYKSKLKCADEEFKQKLKEVEADYEKKMKMLEVRTEQQVIKITEVANQMKSMYETEYVKRSEVDHLRSIIKDLESVKQLLKVSEDKIEHLRKNEAGLKMRLQEVETESRSKITELRAELDRATLQYSEAILEKSRIMDDKSKLETEKSRFGEREADFVRQMSELKADFNTLKKYQKQVGVLEVQITKLQVKISELESKNADLMNKQFKASAAASISCAAATANAKVSTSAETGAGEHLSSSPQRSRILDLYCNRYSPRLINDEETLEVERMHANSSPDLGIESDQGRFSSLEGVGNTNVSLARPLLQTLEVSQSMSNLLDKENIMAKCSNEECSQRTSKIMEENFLLKTKLNKSHKMLEATVVKLAKANLQKERVEGKIYKEIHKTSQILKIAKANLDSGSDTEFKKK